MEDELIEIIEKVIALLEDDNYKVYQYSNNKFHIIDNEQKIDFEAKLCNNSYYFKDNINNLTYIKVKKYLDKNTTIQQIIMETESEKCYYSFLERSNYTSVVKAIRSRKDEILECTNTNVANKKWEDIIKYADSVFEFINSKPTKEDIGLFQSYFESMLDIITDHEADENEFIDDEYLDDEEDYDNDDDYGFDDQDDEDGYDLDNPDEFDNEELGFDNADNSDSLNDDTESPEKSVLQKQFDDYYEKFELRINKEIIEGQRKSNLVASCEAAIDEICFDSITLDEAVNNIRVVLDSKVKKEELEK